MKPNLPPSEGEDPTKKWPPRAALKLAPKLFPCHQKNGPTGKFRVYTVGHGQKGERGRDVPVITDNEGMLPPCGDHLHLQSRRQTQVITCIRSLTLALAYTRHQITPQTMGRFICRRGRGGGFHKG